MKRYLVFIGSTYYPQGGMGDFNGDYDTLTECYIAIEDAQIRDEYKSWWHIYDTEWRKIIKTEQS